MKHDVDYNVKAMANIDSLNYIVDNMRLESLAAAEQLAQILAKNAELAVSYGWNVKDMMSKMETVINILRKEI